jgi:hypothetical protein
MSPENKKISEILVGLALKARSEAGRQETFAGIQPSSLVRQIYGERASAYRDVAKWLDEEIAKLPL